MTLPVPVGCARRSGGVASVSHAWGCGPVRRRRPLGHESGDRRAACCCGIAGTGHACRGNRRRPATPSAMLPAVTPSTARGRSPQRQLQAVSRNPGWNRIRRDRICRLRRLHRSPSGRSDRSSHQRLPQNMCTAYTRIPRALLLVVANHSDWHRSTADRCRCEGTVHSLVMVPVPMKAVADSSAFPSPLVVS